MSEAGLDFPKSYELDELYFTFIVRLIRYEIVTNLSQYSDIYGLEKFVRDLENHRWHVDAKVTIDFTYYCGNVKTYPVFVECLNRVRELLLSFGPEVPEAWWIKLKVDVKDDVFSLNQVRELVLSLESEVSEEWRVHLKPEAYDKAINLGQVRSWLRNYGLEVPEAWLKEQKAKTKDDVIYPQPFQVEPVLYWLDCLRQAVAEYEPNIGIMIFPPPAP